MSFQDLHRYYGLGRPHPDGRGTWSTTDASTCPTSQCLGKRFLHRLGRNPSTLRERGVFPLPKRLSQLKREYTPLTQGARRRVAKRLHFRNRLVVALATLALVSAAAADDSDSIREDRYKAPENWLTYDRDNTGQRYSPLDQINVSNVGALVPKWAFQFVPIPLRTEPTPLVRDGVMYLPIDGLVAHALDAKTGRELWRYEYAHGDRGAPIRSWSRGFALSGERLFMGTYDCHLVALDARTGTQLWRSFIDEPNCFGAPGAPIVARNRVIIGTTGGDSARFRGGIHGFDAETGEPAWRFMTVPEPGQPGSETWPDNDSWKAGGGAAWHSGTYDPELNLIYWTTGNAGPKDFDGRDREGDNLYTASLLALNGDTGERVWHFQFNPHDEHDWDGNQTPMLLNADWEGKPRKLLMQAARNSFFYVLDRETGEMLLAEPFAKQSWAERIMPDGRPVFAENSLPSQKGNLVCPDIHGGTNWQAPSYNPETDLFYVAARDACGMFYRTGSSIAHEEREERQFIRALNYRTGKLVWEIAFEGDEAQQASFAGTMSTGGGLLFFSSRIGNFIAADAKTGELLWHFNTGGSIRTSPITYSVDGRQYVSITHKNGVIVFGLHQ